MCTKPPQWGNFIYHADMDLQAFACLNRDGIYTLSKYHAVQSIEKYLKALALSIEDQDGKKSGEITKDKNSWVRTHELHKLAERCARKYPYYGDNNTLQILDHLSKLDQYYRYPWAEKQMGNFSSANDIVSIVQLIAKVRRDIPIIRDDYPLGMLIRGGHQSQVSKESWDLDQITSQSRVISALSILFKDVDSLVRWDKPLS
ncbi:hypothetical protein KA005_36065 [bacterium]|nr:hypothetical protein [bacterium]